MELLDDAGVANGQINTIAQVFEEPQVHARGLKIELPHAIAGKVPLVASPMRFSDTPIKHEVPAPALGQHTDEILRGVLKKSDAEIAKLKEEGAYNDALALDRIWVRPRQAMRHLAVHVSALARVASDHLPVSATLDFDAAHLTHA